MDEKLHFVASQLPNTVAAANSYAQFMVDEAQAEHNTTFCDTLIPGMLQQPDVAEAILRTYRPNDTDDQISLLVQARIERKAEALRRKTPSTFFISEKVLEVAPAPTTADWPGQLEHLKQLGTEPSLEVRVIPNHNFYIAEDMTTLLRLPGNRATAYLESAIRGDLYTANETIVQKVTATLNSLGSIALDRQDSRQLIEGYLEHYR